LFDHVIVDSPRIDCRQLIGGGTSDVTGDVSAGAVIQCDVTAKPGVVNMFWIVDDNGTTVSDADSGLGLQGLQGLGLADDLQTQNTVMDHVTVTTPTSGVECHA